MNAFKIYISCPIALPVRTLAKYVTAAKVLGTEVTFWKRDSTYRETPNIKACDAFVLILPGECFRHPVSTLPNGCKLEIEYAQKVGKTIFIGYTTAEGIVRFYESDISANSIKGIPGSSHNLPNTIKTYHPRRTSSIEKKSEIDLVIVPVPYI